MASATNSGGGLASLSAKPNGILGGAHVGYNYSTQSLGFGALGGAGGVIGIEGDVDGSNYKKTYLLGGLSDQTRQNIQGSVRGRFGVAVDRALFYATGGVAFGDLGNSYTNTLNGLGDSSSHTRVGLHGRRRRRIRDLQQRVAARRVSLHGLRLVQRHPHQLGGRRRHRPPSRDRQPRPGRHQLQVRHVRAGSSRRALLSRLAQRQRRRIGLIGSLTGRLGARPSRRAPSFLPLE